MTSGLGLARSSFGLRRLVHSLRAGRSVICFGICTNGGASTLMVNRCDGVNADRRIDDTLVSLC